MPQDQSLSVLDKFATRLCDSGWGEHWVCSNDPDEITCPLAHIDARRSAPEAQFVKVNVGR